MESSEEATEQGVVMEEQGLQEGEPSGQVKAEKETGVVAMLAQQPESGDDAENLPPPATPRNPSGFPGTKGRSWLLWAPSLSIFSQVEMLTKERELTNSV